MRLRDVGRWALAAAVVLTPGPDLRGAFQRGADLPDYRVVRDRVAVFGNFRMRGVDNRGPEQTLRTTLGPFGVRQVFDVRDLGPWYYTNRGIIVDGQALDYWKSPTFDEFLTGGVLEAAVRDYVQKGGVLIVTYPALHGDVLARILSGDAWAPRPFGLVEACDSPEPQYEFSAESPLARFLQQQLTGPRAGVVCGVGFSGAEGWTSLVWIQGSRVPVLMELAYGAGRILVFGEPIGLRADDPDLNARTAFIVEGFLRYVAASPVSTSSAGPRRQPEKP